MKKGEPCTVEGCGKPIQARDLCPMHYQRQRIHGTTGHTRHKESSAEMAKRFWGKVGKTPSCWLWQAGTTYYGYGVFSHGGRDLKAHRVAYEMCVGEIPPGRVIDHACHTPACVRPDHLRIATTKQNAENRSGANRNGKSGIRGVQLRESGRWIGQVGHNYVKYTQYFDTQEQAAAYVLAKRQELFTHSMERKVA